MSRKLAVAYARYSTDMQREESIEAQFRSINEFVEREDFEIVAYYQDEALTGKFDNRDNFQRMINDAKKGQFEYILVHKFSRFARNKFDSVFYKKRLRDIGVRVISVTQNIDDTPEGQLLESLLESMDQYFSENISLEAKKGLRENAIKGMPTGGTPPLGYTYGENGEYVIDEQQAHVVRLLFAMYVDGFGTTVIAQQLNAHGYRGRDGGLFDSRTVHRLLQNERLMGTFVYNLDGVEYKTANNHPAIIDKHTFLQAQAIRQSRKSKPRRNNRQTYYLTGKIKCGICGGNYSGGGQKGCGYMKNGRREYHSYYVCSGKRYKRCSNGNINKNRLEMYLVQHIMDNLLTDSAIDAIIIEFSRALDKHKGDNATRPISALKNEISAFERKKDRLVELYMDELLSKADYKDKLSKINNRLAALDNELQLAMIDAQNLMTKEQAREYLHSLKDTFDYESKSMVKALIDTFVHEVIINAHSIDVTFKLDLNSGLDIEKRTAADFEAAATNRGYNTASPFASAILPPLLSALSIPRDSIRKFKKFD